MRTANVPRKGAAQAVQSQDMTQRRLEKLQPEREDTTTST